VQPRLRIPIFTFRTRLAAIASAAVALVIIVIALFTMIGAEHIVFQSIDSTLAKQASDAINLAETNGSVLARNDFYGSMAWVVPAGGSGGNDPLPATSAVLAVASGKRGAYFATVTVNGIPQRELVTPVPRGLTVEGSNGPVPLAYGGALQLTTPVQEVERQINLLRIGIILAAIAGIVVAAGIGWMVARTAIRPLDELAESVEDVSTVLESGSRLDPGSNDELGRLRRAFNHLLDAVDTSRTAQQQLVLDASHELRTPLTSLRTNIEIIDRISELPVHDREMIQRDMLSEIEELTNLVGGLTELVRGDQPPLAAEAFWLDTIVQQSVDAATPYSRTREITINALVTKSCVYGHSDGITKAISNLISNAIKWGPVGSDVWVTCESGVVTVRDEGPGVSPEDVPHIFDRFYRSRAARSLPGSGLGLAIVAQAVDGDGGKVTVSNPESGGAEFAITLPQHDGCS
jgi:two-component system sensor histidine kinase MprB